MPTQNYPIHDVGHFSFGPSFYVPRLQGLAGAENDWTYLVEFGAPAAADTDAISNDQAQGTTFTAFVDTSPIFVGGVIDCPWGRDITAVASGAGVNDLTVIGYDYLGQLVKKTKALNGATPIALGVAFKRLVSVQVAAGGTITVDVGVGANLGMPYRAFKVMEEFVDGTLGTNGTLTTPIYTDPATIATADPRGLYLPNVTPDAVKEIRGRFMLNPFVNSNGNGGLHGIQHFGG